MKTSKYNNYNPLIFNALLFLIIPVLLFQVSCSEKDNNGAPLITNVRFTNPAEAGLTLDTLNGAPLNAWLVIQGNNLATTTNIYFNNVEAVFNPVLITDNNIVINVPESTPTLATHDASVVINELKVVNPDGFDTYDLLVLPPPAIIDSISNEFANPGESITLYGRYFYFIENVTFPGDINADIFSAASDGKTLTLTVPQGATEQGDIVVVTQSGTSSLTEATRFADTTGIFINCEDPTIQVNPAGMQFYNGTINPDIISCRNYYILAFAFSIPPASYWIAETALETNTTAEKFTYPDIPENTPASELMLEFEVNIKDELGSGFFEMAFLNDAEWTDAYRFYWYGWRGFTSGKTNGWVTIRIPLVNFAVDGSGTVPGKTPAGYADIKGEPFNMNFKNPAADIGGLTIPILNIAFDNFRIVKL